MVPECFQVWWRASSQTSVCVSSVRPQKNTCISNIKALWQERNSQVCPLELHKLAAEPQDLQLRVATSLQKSVGQLSPQILSKTSDSVNVKNTEVSI